MYLAYEPTLKISNKQKIQKTKLLFSHSLTIPILINPIKIELIR